MKNKVIIIGAGITGLCSGIYLKKAGYDVEIFEMHSLPGGVCTAWSRKGYTFDGCIDWLLGSSPDGFFNDMWREMGAINDSTQSVEHDIYSVIELSSGKKFTVYTDPEKLKKEMLTLASEDSKEINNFICLIKMFSKIRFPRTIFDAVRVMPFFLANIITVSRFLKLMKTDVKQYKNNFKSSELKEVLVEIINGDISAMALVIMLGSMAKKSGGHVVGGSFQFSKRMEQKYISLGGSVNYNCRVNEVIIENNKAIGVQLNNGDKKYADYIISAADGYDTIFRMLKGKYKTPVIDEAYSTWVLTPRTCQISLGVALEFKTEPQHQSFILKKKISVDPKSEAKRISVQIFNFDPTLAPKGKTSLTIMLQADYDYWSDLRKRDKQEYDKQKERIAIETIEALDIQFPGLKEKVEVWDVATPVTYERYNNVWRGSWEGFWPNANQIVKSLPSKLPGLSNFWMAGQWLKPGSGLPSSLLEGKRVCAEIQKSRD